MSRGVISTELTVWCGGPECFVWNQLSGATRATAKAEWRRQGWKLTRSRGWLCPDCAKVKQADG